MLTMRHADDIILCELQTVVSTSWSIAVSVCGFVASRVEISAATHRVVLPFWVETASQLQWLFGDARQLDILRGVTPKSLRLSILLTSIIMFVFKNIC